MCRVLFAEYLDMNCNKKNKNMPFDIKLFSLQFIKNHIFLQKLGLFPRNITTIFRVLDAEIFIFSPHHLKSFHISDPFMRTPPPGGAPVGGTGIQCSPPPTPL